MSDTGKKGILIKLEEEKYSIAPGNVIEVPVLLVNQSSAPDKFELSVSGIPLVWISLETPAIFLEAGAERKIKLTIQPPAPPQAQIGRYTVLVRITSAADPREFSEARIVLTVAAYEAKGRVGALLGATAYSVVPGEALTVPVVLINQGLAEDSFSLAVEGLPSDWISTPVPSFRLKPGELQEASLVIKLPRQPETRAGRHPFKMIVNSLQAPGQATSIDCTLTVAAFTEYTAVIEPDPAVVESPIQVTVNNLSNTPSTFHLSWSSPEDALAFEPAEPQPVNLPSAESSSLEFSAKPAKRTWFGGEIKYPYTLTVKAGEVQSRSLEGSVTGKAIMPYWVLALIGLGGLLLVLLLIIGLFNPSQTPTPQSTSTQSAVDQVPLLVNRNWYLVSYNNGYSTAGDKEPFTLFNGDGSLSGYTGCNDLSGSFTASNNQISVANLSTAGAACPDATLQGQEQAMLDILSSASSFQVADTAMQIVGAKGVLLFSMSPLNRPEEVVPPTAVIQAPDQALVDQVVTFDGTFSAGQSPVVAWNWDFGDGGQGSGPVMQHVYKEPGAYQVQLSVTDQLGNTGSTEKQIEILAPTEMPPTETPVPVPTATVPPNQPTSTPVPPTEAPVPSEVPPQSPPQAVINGPSEAFVGEPVILDASASQPGSSPITGYGWNFGNGVSIPPSSEPSTSTIYEQAGVYQATVFVTDENGVSSSASMQVIVNARLDSAVWTLYTIDQNPILPGTAITLQFKEGTIAGFAGCTTYSGSYTANDNQDGTYSVVINEINASSINCPTEIMDQEALYLQLLRSVATARLEGSYLYLAYPEGVDPKGQPYPAGELFLYEVGTPKPRSPR